MATSESSLSFVPRRVKATVSRRPPPSVPDRNGAVPPSGASTTSYPKDVLLRVILLAGDGAPRAGDNALRIQRQSRRVLEKLVSHSVDYVHIEDAARGSKANAEVDALERTHWTVIVRTPSSSCAQALLAALLQRNYRAEMLTSEEQIDHWRAVPEAIKNRARGRSERGAYALRKSRAAASQQPSQRR